MTLLQFYMNGIILAHGWLKQAEMRGNQESIESYRRILMDAIDEYKKKEREL